jgi:hypothetical protein
MCDAYSVQKPIRKGTLDCPLPFPDAHLYKIPVDLGFIPMIKDLHCLVYRLKCWCNDLKQKN